MEDDGVQEPSEDSSDLQAQSPYTSPDSRLSESSYANDPMDGNSCDVWEDEFSYPSPEHLQDGSYESLPLTIAKSAEMFARNLADGPSSSDTVTDALEENNNDPNNNMDSNEISTLEEPRNSGKQNEEDQPRTISPRPGCSKDSDCKASFHTTSVADTLDQRVDEVVSVISSISFASIREAISKYPHKAANDFTLAELTSEIMRDPIAGAIPMTAIGKRGPAEDICTTGYKKFSNSERTILLPLLSPGGTATYIFSDKPSKRRCKKAKQKRAEPIKEKLEFRSPTKILLKTEAIEEPLIDGPRDTGAVFVDRSKGAIPKVLAQKSAETKNGIVTTADVPLDEKETTLPGEEKPADNYCVEMFNKLRPMFPNVEQNYLKRLCPPDWGPGDRDAQLTPIVEYLLENSNNLPLATNQDNGENANGLDLDYGNVGDVYENLLGIFPDADPHYLRDFAERNLTPDVIKEFVETKLETRDYPTREQYRARLKITEQQRQYTTGFSINHFLTIIPDPFKHFLDPKRKCKYSTVAFEFLKGHFSKIKVTTISSNYTLKNFNPSLTAEALEDAADDMKHRRIRTDMPTEDIHLLQEMAFIKHKKAIAEHITAEKRAEEAEFKIMKEQNFLVECQCCYDPECVPSKCSSCENGHLFCNNCVVTGTMTKLGDGENCVKCFVNCGSEISLPVLQRVLPPTTFSILLKKRQAAEVLEAGLEGLVSCPFCNFASIPPEEDKIFKCLNPECTKESCRLCKELSHVPWKCNEVMKSDQARHYIEEKMTEAFARKCYKCHRAFFKEEGCNKITCPCGAMMCYICDQPIQNYSHFQGQGSQGKNLCPLYSDTIRLDAVTVRRIGEEAQNEVMKRNPNIKIDTTKLLPVFPPGTRHQGNDHNADELPRRAQRVLNIHRL